MATNLRTQITTHHNQTVRLTKHALDRVTDRLLKVCTYQWLVSKIEEAEYFPEGETHLVVNQLGYIELVDPEVKPDGIARGDIVVASIHNHGGDVFCATVMLRKSWSKSSNYNLRY